MDQMIAKMLQKTTYFDHQTVTRILTVMTERYPLLSYNYLGNSILGRGIPLLSIGSGPREVLYVGTHHGMEWVTAGVLLRFVAELCAWQKRGILREGLSPQFFFESHTLYIIPLLNPDGVEYQLHGIQESNPLYARVLVMNGGSQNFTRWQANARGVDLNHNYDADFSRYQQMAEQSGIVSGAPTRFPGEAAESEPEVAALCNFIRMHDELRGVITLHTQGEEIFCGKEFDARTMTIAHHLGRLCGYRISTAIGLASMSGLTDWCNEIQRLPSFTLECGKGQNPLPAKEVVPIYSKIRPALLRFPTLL